MKKKYIITLLIIGIIFIFGCTQTVDPVIQESDDTTGLTTKATDSGQTETRAQVSGPSELAANYYRFDKAHYEDSLQEGKVIFLDFHANWCPICAREKPRILAAFNELNNENIVGYQVHFNDGDKTADDKEMAKKYGITNQYTKVIIGKNGNVALKTLEILDKERIINELKTVAG